MNAKQKILAGAVIFLVGIVAGMATLYTLQNFQRNEKTDGIACAMDAKQCPDGSYVGRMGPNCEFAPCPTAIFGDGDIGGAATEPESNTGSPVACTMDAKQCPDGSYVGRIAPNCDFAPCPI